LCCRFSNWNNCLAAIFVLRQREIGRYGGNTATGLTLMGNALEGIWLYALMILAYWFLYGNFIQQGLVQPSHMGRIQQFD
jgi:hypothetical protein